MRFPKEVVSFLACCAVRKACRAQHHLKHGFPVVLGLVVPDSEDFEAYADAVEYIAQETSSVLSFGVGWNDTQILTFKHDRKGKTPDAGMIMRKITATPRVIVVVSSIDILPDQFTAVADDILNIPRPDARQIQAAALICCGQRVSPTEASALAEMQLRYIGLTLRKGRSISRSIALMHVWPPMTWDVRIGETANRSQKCMASAKLDVGGRNCRSIWPTGKPRRSHGPTSTEASS